MGSSPTAPTGSPIGAAANSLAALASDPLGAVPRRAGPWPRKQVLCCQRSQVQLRVPERQPGVDQPVERDRSKVDVAGSRPVPRSTPQLRVEKQRGVVRLAGARGVLRASSKCVQVLIRFDEAGMKIVSVADAQLSPAVE